MKDCFYKAIIFFCLVLAGYIGRGQDIGQDLVFDQLGKKQGLPDNSINTILQDSRGFLWLGTNHGLSRYDGRSFKNYNTLGDNGITDKVINCIAEDGKGNIWFGTESGLNKLNPFTEKITQYQEGTGRAAIPFHWCNYLYTDKDKDLWLCTEKGLALYHETADSFQNFSIKVFGKDDRINKFIKKIVEDRDGRFWLPTSYGVQLFDKRTGTCIPCIKDERKDQAKENVFYSLFIDQLGGIWAGSFSAGLFKFNATAGAFEKVEIEGNNGKGFTISGISEIEVQHIHYLLLATNLGLVCLRFQNNKPVSSYSLAGYDLTCFFTDRQNNLWIGAGGGLFKLNSNSLAFKWIPLAPPSQPAQNIFHIIPDFQNPGTDLFLTTQTGWFKYNALTQKIVAHHLPADKNNLLSYINHYTADSAGYWFTSVQGFGYYNMRSNKLLDLSQVTFAASGEKTTGFVLQAMAHVYWITLKRNGILLYNDLTKKDTVIFGDKSKPDNTYGHIIHDMQKGSDGNIWFTSNSKLYIIDPKTFSYKIFAAPSTPEKVADTKISPQGILFTKSGKILVYSKLRVYEFNNERLITVYPAKGLSTFSIDRIIDDEENNFWVQTDEDIFKTNTNFSRWEPMNKLPGLQDANTVSEISILPGGDLLFASEGKLGVLKQNLLKKNTRPSAVIISRVRYGQQENYLVSLQKTNIESSYKDAIEIELSPADFINEKENSIQYQLGGWDNEWKVLSNGSVIRYEQLPPGTYRFIARSLNPAGMEGPETVMVFKVVPPFYRTWWFIVLIIIILATAVFLFYRFRLKKALELEQMRNRIATDLHDDIGATLSSISLYSQAVKSKLKGTDPQLENVLDKMGENSRDMVASMNDIVWAINPVNDDGEKLVKRMDSYATDMCAVKNIRLHFNADESLNLISLQLEHRKNIYLIFKEAINNAVKYANAADIWVNIQLHNKKLDMMIKDNGSGFDKAKVKAGNGLKSLYARAAEIKGTMQINSIAGKAQRFPCIARFEFYTWAASPQLAIIINGLIDHLYHSNL